MNSTPDIAIIPPVPPTLPSVREPFKEKPTVPEMFLLLPLIKRAVRDPQALRDALARCEPEQRSFLHTFFAGIKTEK